MIAPAPAEASGRKSRSHSEPPAFTAATTPVKMSAAATGVSNSAPIVAEVASSIASWPGTCGSSRANTAAISVALIAMTGFSGPRLTPPASARIVTSASPGSALTGIGGGVSSVVAESGPPCPGTRVSASPTASPVVVSTSTIHHPDGSTPRASGTVVQSSPSSAAAMLSTVHSTSAATIPTTMAGTASRRSRPGEAFGSRGGTASVMSSSLLAPLRRNRRISHCAPP